MADGECNASLGQEEIVSQDQSKQWRELLKSAIVFERPVKSRTCISAFNSPLRSTTSDNTSLHFAASVLKAKRVFGSLFQPFLL